MISNNRPVLDERNLRSFLRLVRVRLTDANAVGSGIARRLVVSVACATPLVPLAPAHDAAAVSGGGCRVGGETVVANRFVRVFQLRRPEREHEFTFAVCARNARRAHVLFASSMGSDVDAEQAVIGGWNVAYVVGRCRPGPDSHQQVGCKGRVVVYDARSRRSRSIPVSSNQEGTVIPVTDLIVTASGSAAWLIRNRDDPRTLELWATSASGPRRLDVGEVEFDAPEESSLALAGTRLYWQLGEMPKSLVFR